MLTKRQILHALERKGILKALQVAHNEQHIEPAEQGRGWTG